MYELAGATLWYSYIYTSERKKFVPNKKGYVGMVWSQSLTTPQLQHPIKIP